MGGLKSWKQKIWLKCVSRLSETDVVRCRPDPLTETKCFFCCSVLLVSLLLCCIYGSFGFLFSLQPPDKTVSMSCEENGFLKWARTLDSAVISLELAVDLLINSVIFFLKKALSLYCVYFKQDRTSVTPSIPTNRSRKKFKMTHFSLVILIKCPIIALMFAFQTSSAF